MKLLITGISGLLGLNLARQCAPGAVVSGCYHIHPITIPGVEAWPLDVTSSSATMEMFGRVRPDVIVNTVGLTDVEKCEADPGLAYKLNAEAAQNVALAAKALDARLVHISTDHLFDGLSPWKTESDAPTPINTYARTKLQGEQAVLQSHPSALIIRTNFFGWGTSIRTSFSDWILGGLEQQQELTMFTDAFFTPILVNDLVDKIMELAAQDQGGVFNIAGAERVSKYSFAKKMARVFGLKDNCIRPISIEDVTVNAPRPKDMSLTSKKVEDRLNIRMPTVDQGLERLRSLQQQGWGPLLEDAIQGTPQTSHHRG